VEATSFCGGVGITAVLCTLGTVHAVHRSVNAFARYANAGVICACVSITTILWREVATTILATVVSTEVSVVTRDGQVEAIPGNGIAGVFGAWVVIVAGFCGEETTAKGIACVVGAWISVVTLNRRVNARSSHRFTSVGGARVVIIAGERSAHTACRCGTGVDGTRIPIVTADRDGLAAACFGVAGVVGTVVAVIACNGVKDAATRYPGFTFVCCAQITIITDRRWVDALPIVGVALIVGADIVVITIFGNGFTVSKRFTCCNSTAVIGTGVSVTTDRVIGTIQTCVHE